MQLSPAAKAVSCLWLHHGRLRMKEDMAPTASLALSAWHRTSASSTRGLIAVAFDQRNHGSRKINDLNSRVSYTPSRCWPRLYALPFGFGL